MCGSDAKNRIGHVRNGIPQGIRVEIVTPDVQ
jgi:hypothetical protein